MGFGAAQTSVPGCSVQRRSYLRTGRQTIKLIDCSSCQYPWKIVVFETAYILDST